jgi:IstB-like ATP binding protein/Mu transposase, C-terminal domain
MRPPNGMQTPGRNRPTRFELWPTTVPISTSQAEFWTPATVHEKGGVEGEAGYFRRNHWVPVPEARDLEDLNEQLLRACQQDRQSLLAGREVTVGVAMQAEQEHLLPLPREGFELAEVSFPRVDGSGCVRVRTNFYSVPVRAGSVVEARVYPARVELWQEGICVARHERCYGRRQQILDLEHYLEVLEQKPGALAGSKPLEQWRRLGRWPACYDRFWEELVRRHGKPSGTRQMIGLLQLGKAKGYARLRAAVESVLALGCGDEAAVRYLMLIEPEDHRPQEALEVGWLNRYERSLPVVNDYDQLLAAGAVMSSPKTALQATAIQQQCKLLHLPAVGSQCAGLAELAVKEKQSHLDYLEALLAAELEEREHRMVGRRLREARLPGMKTLEEFDFSQSPKVSATEIRQLAEGGYIERAEPILFIEDCGTGKTHLMSGLCVAAWRQKRRVRFTTTAELVNELVEAKQQLQLRRVMAPWARYELVAIDEQRRLQALAGKPLSTGRSKANGKGTQA